jgi:UDP-3-O-[3-hydroxymyristoyl] glucosamine N-acyltransferase
VGSSFPGESEVIITGFAGLRQAVTGDLGYFQDARYTDELQATRASVVLVPTSLTEFPSWSDLHWRGGTFPLF